MTIEARGLTKHFGSKLAVDDLTFTVRPGHVTGFLGPNGAGKSTTMRMILGLDRPSSGSVKVAGRPYGEVRRPLHHIGAVLEVGSVHKGRSAYNHLLCLAQSNGIGRRRVDEVLELVGLTGVRGGRAGKFSLGMGQRLGLAAALLGDPPILICDEPVNGLDPEGILWIRNLLRYLAGEGRTVFVSSHLMNEMALTADHLIIIGQGRLIADETTEAIIARTGARYMVVRSPEAAAFADQLRQGGAEVAAGGDPTLLHVKGFDLERIGEIARSNGFAIYELRAEAASLEEAFIELTRNSVEFHAGSHQGVEGGAR